MELNQKKLEEILTKGFKTQNKELKQELRKELGEDMKKIENNFQRYLGVVAEDFKSQVQLVAESLSGIQRQLKAIAEMVAKNTEDIEMLKIKVFSMDSRLSSMEAKIEHIEVKIEHIESDVQIIKQGMKRKVDVEEFEVLEKRVIFLEKKLKLKYA